MILHPWVGKYTTIPSGPDIYLCLEDLGDEKGASGLMWIDGFKDQFMFAFAVSPKDIMQPTEDDAVVLVQKRIDIAAKTLIHDWMRARL